MYVSAGNSKFSNRTAIVPLQYIIWKIVNKSLHSFTHTLYKLHEKCLTTVIRPNKNRIVIHTYFCSTNFCKIFYSNPKFHFFTHLYTIANILPHNHIFRLSILPNIYIYENERLIYSCDHKHFPQNKKTICYLQPYYTAISLLKMINISFFSYLLCPFRLLSDVH